MSGAAKPQPDIPTSSPAFVWWPCPDCDRRGCAECDDLGWYEEDIDVLDQGER